MTRKAPLELWGGPECSIVRIGEEYRDQSIEIGHAVGCDDLALIADLGVRTIRYPILWEAVAADRPGAPDLTQHDAQLAMLRARGINIIAGLVHHGSGPLHTDLLDPDFPLKLAEHAARVARLHPWIGMWTPINEPLTTARFSALYGHWYPHRRDFPSFVRALINESLATLEAMRAIRAVNPGARLVQTEDLGKTFSTPPLGYQAAHENERRWLSFDLLCGRIDPAHPWHRILLDAGASAEELARFEGGEARPDLLGINHYLTSERFLDHRLDRYPGLIPGGNGRDSYVDAEAVRIAEVEAEVGIACRLREAWDRYRIPIAITEVHHGCTRDEQLRWFSEVWRAAASLRDEGVDVRAVTLWSIFGAMDWRSLLTARDGSYDAGAFDARSPRPRATAIAAAARAFAQGKAFDHPVLDVPGWWRRPQRLYAPDRRSAPHPCPPDGRKLLITGATGTLGRAFARICGHRGLPFHLTSRHDLDICREESIAAAIEVHRPWAVINAAGFVRVADAEREPEACMAANADGPARLSRACEAAGIRLVTFSSDLVFDGLLGRPYREDDPVRPASVYGRSKAEAERAVLDIHGQALVVRTSAFFGAWDEHNFARHVLRGLAAGEGFAACPATIVSPTFVPDLCNAVLDLLIDGETGIWHVANRGAVSWHEFARRIAAGAGHDPALIRAVARSGTANTALASARGMLLRPLDQAIDAFLADARNLVDAAETAAA